MPKDYGGGWVIPTEKERFLKSRETEWANDYGGVVPHYPSIRHIEQNLAPELGITRMQIDAMAQANAIARKNNLMSPALADKMLPTLLVEGASGTNGWGYPDTKPYRDILTRAGLPPTVEEINKLIKANISDTSSREYPPNEKRKRYDRAETFDNDLIRAQMMHAMMAAKALNYGEDKAIERWNGQGTARGGWANAANHARKVEETAALLKHPKNKELMDTWNSAYQQHSDFGNQAFKAQLEDWSKWEDNLNVPGIIGYPISAAVKAVRGVLPDENPLKALQNKVRNWTAPTPPSEYKKGGKVKLPKNHKNGGGSGLI